MAPRFCAAVQYWFETVGNYRKYKLPLSGPSAPKTAGLPGFFAQNQATRSRDF
jgi:hypothetical protein